MRALSSILLLFSLALVPRAVGAQTAPPEGPLPSGMEEVVYFENGEVLRGRILERSEEALRIETVGRNVFVVQMDEVREIAREEIPEQQHFMESGYVNQTGLAVLPGRGTTTLRFEIVHGYRIGPHVTAGLGLGYSNYRDPVSLVSAFANLRYNLLKGGVTPYAYLRAGYGFSIWADESESAEEHRGGPVLNPGLGVQYNTRGRHAWYLSMGYSHERAAYEWEDWDERLVEERVLFRRVQIGFGLIF